MNMEARAVMEAMTEASDAETITFPEVVKNLMAVQVERYHADLLRAEKVYYLPDGTSHVVAAKPLRGTPAQTFAPTGVAAAVRAVQAQQIRYNEFCDRIAAAGCVGYFVSMAGRRAVYYGRGGDSYVEPFPGAR